MYRTENADGLEGIINLSNIAREIARDGNIYCAIRFADSVAFPACFPNDWSKVKHQVIWDIQSNTLVGQSDLAFHLSDQTHQIPVILDTETMQILHLDSHMLIELAVSEEIVAEAADENLSAALCNALFSIREHEGVRFAVVGCPLPFKAALILAPNLREIAEPLLGWPLFAVVPRRNYMYLYDARCFENGVTDIFEKFPGLGDVVLEEFDLGAHPLSTEIFEISDDGVRAVAEYRRHPPGEMAEEAQAD